mmetsp:Transcript_25493/g.59073  ORF Transcript_25493/g.59073 Transcript_25493/m.59073 type:complete len:248 (-) Transcript_25493:18-761(-)
MPACSSSSSSTRSIRVLVLSAVVSSPSPRPCALSSFSNCSSFALLCCIMRAKILRGMPPWIESNDSTGTSSAVANHSLNPTSMSSPPSSSGAWFRHISTMVLAKSGILTVGGSSFSAPRVAVIRAACWDGGRQACSCARSLARAWLAAASRRWRPWARRSDSLSATVLTSEGFTASTSSFTASFDMSLLFFSCSTCILLMIRICLNCCAVSFAFGFSTLNARYISSASWSVMRVAGASVCAPCSCIS